MVLLDHGRHKGYDRIKFTYFVFGIVLLCAFLKQASTLVGGLPLCSFPPRNISGLQKTMSQVLFSTMGSVPELRQAFVYLDFALDRMQQQLELMQGGSLEEMRKFINADTMLTLMTQAPEMLQTAMYTILTQPAKVSVLSKSDVFCSSLNELSILNGKDWINSIPPQRMLKEWITNGLAILGSSKTKFARLLCNFSVLMYAGYV